MKHGPSNRVAERLRRLREKFGAGIHDRHVDHDQDNLTSTRRDLVPARTFFLGEIWWADRYALGDHRPYREGSSHRPALVTRREVRPYAPVEAAPSRIRSADINDGDSARFDASSVQGLLAGTFFVLGLRRPIPRAALGRHLATLDTAQKQRLARTLDLLRNSGGDCA